MMSTDNKPSFYQLARSATGVKEEFGHDGVVFSSNWEIESMIEPSSCETEACEHRWALLGRPETMTRPPPPPRVCLGS